MSENSEQVSASAAIFAEAATWVCALVEEIPEDVWHLPGLGNWDLRGLVGHTSRALITAHAASVRPADAAGIPRRAKPGGAGLIHPEPAFTAEDYFLRAAALPGANDESVRSRGVESGIALGDDISQAFARLAETAISATGEATATEVADMTVETISGVMRLSSYLETRTFELVVHGLDICRARGRTPDAPAAALRETLLLCARLAARGGHGAELLLAVTGRTPLSAGFTVLVPRSSPANGISS